MAVEKTMDKIARKKDKFRCFSLNLDFFIKINIINETKRENIKRSIL